MLGWKPSLGQAGPVPGQFSATSQSPADARHVVPLGLNASAGQPLLDPVQVSARSQSPAAARQMVPPLPAGCWQALLDPSHSSSVQGLLSAVQGVPAALFVSAGQFGAFPGHISAGSHSPAEARHCVKADRKPSAGQLVLEPVQFSTSSHGPAAARHTAPALPAGCWQLLLLPSHWSRLHGFPSLVHAVPAGCFASAGHVVLEPVHVSATSHSPADARHVTPAWPAGCWQASFVPSHSSELHGLPSSVHAVPAALFASAGQLAADPVQFSAGSHSPADDRHVVVAGSKASAGQTVLVPVQLSATSHGPATARQVAPALPAGCWQTLLEPSH